MGKSRRTAARETPLDQLAAYLGIESSYSDARSKLQHTSTETKRALLQAMDVPANDDIQIDAALREMELLEWNRVLQPVYVVRADGESVSIDVTLPVGSGESSRLPEISWVLRLEGGSEKSGRVDSGSLAVVGRREIGGKIFERRQLPIGKDIPCGYHRVKVNSNVSSNVSPDVNSGVRSDVHSDVNSNMGSNADSPASEAMVIVAPVRCWLPASAEAGRKIWGVAAQLYVLRSQHNWGIGDFGDLRQMAGRWAEGGVNVVGLNPLHALFPDAPEQASPYSPASRLLLNVLYIDVTAAPGFAECKQVETLVASEEFQEILSECRAASCVDYTRVTRMKLQALRALFNHWESAEDGGKSAFANFRGERGQILECFCVFQCLRRTFLSRDADLWDWRKWPEAYRDPSSAEVRKFAEEHRQEIEFEAWMQWLADRQLAAAADAAKAMEIGLYRDMAVGCDMAGVETWSNQRAVVSKAHIGAPPDIFNPAGQDWGLPPFHPRALKEERYESFVDLIRANMRHAGALRIDHVMALQHLYWIPEAQKPPDGAYVRYPMEDLIGILALESQRNRCMVVGEDLGTVPDGFRERMAEACILSYRVLFFEQKAKSGVFRTPETYPKLSVGVASNHDLPTVLAWWLCRDVELRESLKLYPDAKEAEFQRQLRDRDRKQLRRALEKQGLVKKLAKLGPEEVVLQVHAYLARSSSFAALVQLDDLTGEVDPVNLPGSTFQYPNWRRKLSVAVEDIFEEPLAKEIVRLFSEERGSANRLFQNAAG